MTIKIQSGSRRFSFSLSSGAWTYQDISEFGCLLHCAPLSLQYSREKAIRQWVLTQTPDEITSEDVISSPHGPARHRTFSWHCDQDSLAFRLEVALPEAAHLLLWRFHLINSGAPSIRLIEASPLMFTSGQDRSPIVFNPASSHEAASQHAWAVFTDGWQSWNFAGVFAAVDKMPRSRLGPLVAPMRYLAGSQRPRRAGHIQSDMFAVLGDRGKRRGLLMGFLSQAKAFGQIELQIDQAAPRGRMRMHLDDALLPAGQTFTSDWACLQPVDLESDAPLAHYLDAVGRENQARVDGEIPVGWCSWYYAFNKVMQEDVLAALEWAGRLKAEIPLGLIQLDDGFESAVGDWFDTQAGFPDGLAHLPERIHGSGFRAGLWLAPLIASRRSKLARQNPGWVLRNRFGIASNPGFIFNCFPFALDPTHPEVLDYCKELVGNVRDWGYDYLKLDFLYAGALPGKRYDPTQTRAQALRGVLEGMRQAGGDQIFLLGCGCPLGSGVGIFDAMRINPDVAPRWYPSHFGIQAPLKQEEGLPSARNAILTTINRSSMHRRWWINDPDCLLLRDQMMDLTPAEVQTLATVIGMSAGSIIDSDPLPSLNGERKGWFARLLPPLPEAARVVDWFDREFPRLLTLTLHGPQGSWQLAAVINWSDERQTIPLLMEDFGLNPAAAYHVMDFWCGTYSLHQGPELQLKDIDPHGIRALSLSPKAEGVQWIGDNLHLSQGLGVIRWEVKPSRVEIGIDLGRKAEGKILLQLPSTIAHAKARSGPCTWKELQGGIYEIDLATEGQDTLTIVMDDRQP